MIEFDPEKDRINRAKHGVPLAAGLDVLRDPSMVEFLDRSVDHGEERWITTGHARGVVLTIVYTMRSDRVRLISVRKATHDEARRYFFHRERGGEHER